MQFNTIEEAIEAWAVLIKTKLCDSLQGWFGRQAESLINEGYIDRDGTLDWVCIDTKLKRNIDS